MNATAESKLTKNQARTYRVDFLDDDERPVVLISTVRYDDRNGNGHNTLSITADKYEQFLQRGEPTVKHKNGRTLWMSSCGMLHADIAAHLPELAPLLKWHLCSSDGPMHYIPNTVYLAGDRDPWGLREGEKRQIKNGKSGLPAWHLVAVSGDGEETALYRLQKSIDSETQPPCPHRLEYRPWCTVGEGKARDLDAARRAAVWPEATDAELSAEPDELKAKLEARLPALLAEFRRAVESLGFTW